MGTREKLLTGVAIGSGLMFLLDPAAGRRRRALTRDKAGKWSRQAGRAMRTGWQRTADTGRGAVALVNRVRQGERNDDEAVAQRLRRCIGRHSTHPNAIEVTVNDGVAKFSGPILSSELHEVLRCASAVSGVRAVENRLEPHDEAGTIPALQGEAHRRPWTRWWEKSPALRIGTGAAAIGLAALVASRGVARG
jgi:osmotically-inducible protein OsmY